MAAPPSPPSTSGSSGGHCIRSYASPSLKRAVLKAASDGDLRRLKKLVCLLDWGEGLVAEKLSVLMDDKGRRVLHAATTSGSLAMCRYLVEDIGLEVDALCLGDETPLSFAITHGYLDLASYFLDQGADIERHNIDGCTPLDLAASAAKPEMVELLLSKGANIDSLSGGGGATPLHVAAMGGRDDVVKILLDHHADHTIPFSLAGHSSTALAAAVSSGSLKCVKLLLEAGADVNGIGDEPLVLAASAGFTDILRCLVLAGANPNVRDKCGRAPIERAALRGRREDVEILFPVTSPSPNIRDWTVDGILGYGKSVKQVMLEADEALKSGNYLAAAQLYTEVIDLHPDYSFFANRNKCWLHLGDAEKALMDAQVYTSMQPASADPYYRQGLSLMLMKDYEKACDTLLDGLKLEPGHVNTEKELRYALESLKTSGIPENQDSVK